MSRMIRSRKFALASVVVLPLVAGGFMLQSRVTRGGEALLDQVLPLVSERFVDTLDAEPALREGGARTRERAQRSVQRAARARRSCKAFNTQDRRPVRRHRHADRATQQTQIVDQQGLPEHAR